MDFISQADQAVESAKQIARPMASFYKKLIEEDIPHDTATRLAVIFAERTMEKGADG